MSEVKPVEIKVVCMPLDLMNEIITILEEIPAKRVFTTLKRIETQTKVVNPIAPKKEEVKEETKEENKEDGVTS